MIVQLKGKVINKTVKSIYVATNAGIIFEVFTTINNLNRINLNEEILLHTFLKVREDGFELYGFLNESEREAFKVLISISKVGPKIAISLLNTYNFEKLLQIVENEDIEALSRVNGIGKKNASRIILELAGKLVTVKNESQLPLSNNFEDAKAGLLNMGFDSTYIDPILRELEQEKPEMKVKDIIKWVLKNGK